MVGSRGFFSSTVKFRGGLLTPLLNLLEHVSDGAAVEEDVLLAPHLAVVDHHHQHHQLRQDPRRGVQDGLGDSCQRNFAKKTIRERPC